MSALTRRKALTVVAVAPAAVAALPAQASPGGEDAELLRLFKEWNAESVRCKQLVDRHEAIEEAVAKELGEPYWEFVGLRDGPHRAIFISASHDDSTLKIVPLKSRCYEARHREAHEAHKALRAEREAARRSIGRKYKEASADRAWKASMHRMTEIEDKIAETPAEGLTGLAIKLAFASTVERDFMQKRGKELIDGAYEAVKKLAGVDYAAQLCRW